MFEKITNRFQFKFKDRVTAANILGESLKDKIKKQEEQRNAVVLGIPRGGVITADIVAKKLSTDNFDTVTYYHGFSKMVKSFALGRAKNRFKNAVIVRNWTIREVRLVVKL